MYILGTNFCDTASGLATILFIKKIVNVLIIVIPAILIVFLTIDFAKAVIANDEKQMKDAQSQAIKRIIYAVVIFFVPIVANAIFNFIGERGVKGFDCYSNATEERVDALAKEQEQKEKEAKQEQKQQDQKSNNNNSSTTPKSNNGGSSTNSKSSGRGTSDKNTSKKSDSSKKTDTTSEVPSAVKKAKSYKSYHYLKTLNAKHSADVKPIGNNFISQSFAVVNNYYVVMLITRGETSTIVSVHNKNTGKRVNTLYTDYNHANGAAYDTSTGKVYVAYGGLSYKYGMFPAKDIESRKKLNGTSKFSKWIQSAMAYDRVTHKYYISGGRAFKQLNNSKNKKVKEIKRKVTAGLRQDIGAHNGILYACRHNGGNFVDLYRESDGKYLGTYKINVSGEIESIDYYGKENKFAVLVYNSGYASDKIYIVNIPIP